jgi:hypothetical protein
MKKCFISLVLLLLTLAAYSQAESTNTGFGSGNSRWKGGAGIYSGYCALTGDLHHYFNDNVPLGLCVQAQYSIIVMNFRASIAFSHLANDINYDGGTWEADSWVSSHFYDVSLGLNIGDPKSISLTPFAGIGSSDFLRTQLFKDDDYEPGDGELGDTFTYSFGMNMDIHLSTRYAKEESMNKASMSTYLRLGYTYSSPHFEKKHDGFGGRMQFFTLGIVLLQNL